MSKETSKESPATATERLKEFVRTEKQEVGRSPPNTRSGGSSSNTQSNMPAEKPAKLSLERVHSQLMAAITASNTMLTGKMEEIRMDIGLIHHDLQAVRERMAEAEKRISSLEDNYTPVPNRILAAEKQVTYLNQKVDDLENRLRRNNIRFVGLPERAEGKNPGDFVETWIKTLFPDTTFSTVFAVERAHRIPAKPPAPGAPARPLLARFLNCKDRDLILRKARQKGTIQYENAQVFFFPDFSIDLQKLRATFFEVKKKLRERHIIYSMAYPARMRVEEDGKIYFFNTPESVQEWLCSKGTIK